MKFETKMQFVRGQIIKGKVVARPAFGVFVEIHPNIVGLVKITNANLGGKGPSALPQIGEEVLCEVIESELVGAHPKINMRILPNRSVLNRGEDSPDDGLDNDVEA